LSLAPRAPFRPPDSACPPACASEKGKVTARATLGDLLHVAPAPLRLEERKHVSHPAAFVLVVVVACGGHPALAGEGARTWATSHPPDELRPHRRDGPPLLQPRFETPFLSVRLTVWSHISSTSPTSTSLLAKSCIVQSSRPSGASEQRPQGHQVGFLMSVELAGQCSAEPGPLRKRRPQTLLHEALARPLYGSHPRVEAAGYLLLVGAPLVCEQECVRSSEPTSTALWPLCGSPPATAFPLLLSSRSTTYFFFTGASPVLLRVASLRTDLPAKTAVDTY
jgi:hypothetical protein